METDILHDVVQANEDAQKAKRDADRQLRDDFKNTFLRSQSGERVLEYLSDYTMYLGSAYTGNAKTYFNEGAQAVCRHILLILGLTGSAKLVTMLKLLDQQGGHDDD